MSDELVLDLELIEIDKSKKYFVLLKDDTLDIDEVQKQITDWLERNDMPLMIAFENQVHFLEVVEETDEED